MDDVPETPASIESLPNEVLSLIFEAGYILSPLPLRQFETLISQVTRRWRNVACKTPLLWTRCHIPLDKTWYEEMTLVYLHRSGALPLNIRVDLAYMVSKHEISEISHILCQHIHRWQRIQIISDTQAELHKFLGPLALLEAPILESIQLSLGDNSYTIQNEDESDLHSWTRKIFAAPCLRSVRMNGVGFHDFLPPLSALSKLHLHQYSTNQVGMLTGQKSFLNKLTNLTHLVVDGDIFYEDPSLNQDNDIELPLLRYLRIRASWDDASVLVPRFLHALSAPVLEALSLETVISSEIGHLLRLTSGVPKFPSLRSLALFPYQELHLSESLLHQASTAFPSIVRFVCPLSSDGIQFLGRSTTTAPGSVLWSKLETLSLIDRYELGKSMASEILEMLSARMCFDKPLHRLQLCKRIFSEFSQEDLNWMSEIYKVKLEENPLDDVGDLDDDSYIINRTLHDEN